MAAADSFLGWILDASHLARAGDLPYLTSEGARRFGARDAALYVVDYEQTVLVPMSAEMAPIPIDGTDAGRCFSEIEMVDVAEGGQHVVWTPLLDGTERLGVLRVLLHEVTDETRAACRFLAGLMAELVATRAAYTDVIERLRRNRPMSLPAEIQWSLLPPLTHSNRWSVISCILAPCYEVGGDAFDYAVDGTVLRWGVFDAMGHGLEASLLAAVTIASYRNARRDEASLEDAYVRIDAAISEAFGPDRFVTGIIGELDLETGALRRINAGHPAAVRIAQDGSVRELAVAERSLPFGVGGKPIVLDAQLEAGDRLVFYTDGVVEARDENGTFFGVEGLVRLINREVGTGRPASETLRRLSLAIAAHQNGIFQDDATTMIIEWRGDERSRTVLQPAIPR